MKHTEHFDELLHTRRCTLLGLGPMSRNCVDAIIELGNELKTPFMLIASRRQVEAKEFGGGYVNNWTTEDFAEYVRGRDRGGYIVLVRDHGGAKNELERCDGIREALLCGRHQIRIPHDPH